MTNIKFNTFKKATNIAMPTNQLILTMTRFSILTLLILLFVISASQSHVHIDRPKGGDVLAPFSEINIKWTETQDHGENNWDLFYSLDGGEVWNEIVLDLEETVLEYAWKIPAVESAMAKIRVIQDNSEGTDYEYISENFSISVNPPDVEEPEVITALEDFENNSGTDLQLSNYPNPFNSQTTIKFSIAQKGRVELYVYNVLGRKVFVGTDRVYDKGPHEILMKNQDLPNGIYLAILLANNQKLTSKMIMRP